MTEWVEAKGLPEQRTTLYIYDQYSQLTTSVRGAGDAKQVDAIALGWQYDNAGNATVETDGGGNTRKTTYDQRGAPTSRLDSLNRTTIFNFDPSGNLVKIIDPLGNTTRMRYDLVGKRTHTISPLGNEQVIRYDRSSRVIENLAPGEVEGAGRRTKYDSNGWPVQSISPTGLIVETSYDERGRIKKSKDPSGNVTSYEYGDDDTEQAGQLILTQYPTYQEIYKYDRMGRRIIVSQQSDNKNINSQIQTYDALGRLVVSNNALGRSSFIKFDALGRAIQVTDAAGQQTTQTWNAHDLLVSLTDAKGNVHRFEYDKNGKIIKEIRPLGGGSETFLR